MQPDLPAAVTAVARLEQVIQRCRESDGNDIDHLARFVGRPLPLGGCLSCGRENSTLTLHYEHPGAPWVELGCGCIVYDSQGIDAICGRLADAT